jgi:thiosulfate reductase cytochrome b subunit
MVRLTHWATVVLLAGMVTSGLQIYEAYSRFGNRGDTPFPSPFDATQFPRWSRLGGWLAGALNWHFALMWPLFAVGLGYAGYLAASGEWRALLFRPRDVPGAVAMARYYLRLRYDHPPQGKHNPLQKLAYSSIVVFGALAVLTGVAIYKPLQFSWLTTLFGGYQAARYWHFWMVWVFVGFTIVHVILVFVVDPASLRAMLTGRYRGRFPSHD